MTPRTSAGFRDRRRSRPCTQRLERQLADLAVRLERAEDRITVLETTLDDVARRTGTSVGPPCTHCDRGSLLVHNSVISCPTCGYQRSI